MSSPDAYVVKNWNPYQLGSYVLHWWSHIPLEECATMNTNWDRTARVTVTEHTLHLSQVVGWKVKDDAKNPWQLLS